MFTPAKPNPSRAEAVLGGALGSIRGTSEEVEYLIAWSDDLIGGEGGERIKL
jgi:hypothetical protein